MHLLIVGLVSFVSCREFGAIYAFGDSFSDNGNLFSLREQNIPNPQLYFKGRFSNGPVWVEYLADMLKVNLTDMAYASATTDNDMFKATLSADNYYIPGCLQQVHRFSNQYATRHKSFKPVPDDVLVTMGFLGNDFFLPGSTVEAYVQNLKVCLDDLISTTNLTNIMFITTNPPETFPAVSVLPKSVSEPIVLKLNEAPALIDQMLLQTKAKFPMVNFYPFDLATVLRQISNATSPYLKSTFTSSKPCLQKSNNRFVKCADPDASMFWDELHPTTKVHEAIAAAAADLLH